MELFQNNQATTTVSSGGTTAPAAGTSESWTVASSAMFGTAATGISQFHVSDIALPTEVITVTNVSGTTWTVTRGAENTTPVAHTTGFTVYQNTTAGFLTSVQSPMANFGYCPVASPIAQTVPYFMCNGGTTQSLTYIMAAPVMLAPGQVVNNLSFFSVGAVTAPTHWFLALYRWNGGTPMQMAHSADQLTNAVAANTLYTLPMVTPYTIPSASTDIYFIGSCFNGTTAGTIATSTTVATYWGPTGGPAKYQGFHVSPYTTPGTDGSTTVASGSTAAGGAWWYCAS